MHTWIFHLFSGLMIELVSWYIERSLTFRLSLFKHPYKYVFFMPAWIFHYCFVLIFFLFFFPPNSAYKKTMDILKYKHEMQEIFSSWCWLPGHKEQGLFVLNYLHQPKTDLQALRNATYFWTKKIWNGLCILLLFCLFFAAHEESKFFHLIKKKIFFHLSCFM